MGRFEDFIGIDYSGAEGPTSRLQGLRVYAASKNDLEPARQSAPSKGGAGRAPHWSRREVAEMLLSRARAGRRFIAGIDHCFSFPLTYLTRHGLHSWTAFLDDFVAHWPTHLEGVRVDFVRDGIMHREHGYPPPDRRTGAGGEFRLTERWTSSAKCVFVFDVNGSVAKSSHAGIPWLKWLREQAGERLHFWPFDGWAPDPGKSVIVEIYPSIFRHRYERGNRTADEQDAYATARWLADMASRGALAEYFVPPLTAEERRIADVEGWIFGIR